MASQDTIDELKEFDSATVFNAVVANLGGSQGGRELEGKGGIPENYTGPEIRCLLPELGRAVGYAVTSEVTTNDPESVAIPWDEYYETLDRTAAPIMAVMKDVDTRPGRGACVGDGMATLHMALGVVGAVVDGSVRDLMGIKDAGLPVWGRGTVPGHGIFSLIRVNSPVAIGRLLIHPGELIVADTDGCTKIPAGHDPEDILRHARAIRERELEGLALYRDPNFTLDMWRERRRGYR